MLGEGGGLKFRTRRPYATLNENFGIWDTLRG